MAKIDLITLTGFTASDGSIVASGATVKFDSEFYARSNNVMIRPRVFRNREIFDAGFTEIRVIEIPNEFILQLTDEDFYTLTPAVLYEKVRDYLNNSFGDDYFEINIIN
jgi:hypothetical protein